MKNNENNKNLIRISLLLLGIGIVLSFGINTTSAANTSNIYVNTHGNDSWNGLNSTWIKGTLNGPKATIKNATATIKTGGTVNIADGTYNENNIQINTDMTIIGTSQENTIINGGKLAGLPATIFIIPSGVKVTINDLTIENGYSDDNQGNNGLGGAINNNGILTVNAITFTGNTAAEYGGAIYNTGNLNVNKCTFSNNIVTSEISDGCNGGAIYNSGKLTITESKFNNNTSINNGGAIFNSNIGELTVKTCSFTNNIGSQYGYGGAIGSDGNSTVSDSTFTMNYASPGGALANFGNMNVTNCVFNNNSATMLGGALLNIGYLNLTSCKFNGNTDEKGEGGAICNGGYLTLINNNTFTKNSAEDGGAIFNAGTLTIINNNSFIDNNAESNGGAIYNTIYSLDNQILIGTANIKSAIFKANKASFGGAIYSTSNFTLMNSTFQDNTASNGNGGVLAYGNGGAISFVPPEQEIIDPVKTTPTTPTKAANAADSTPAIGTTKTATASKSSAGTTTPSTDTVKASIINCIFINNSADNGGAIENWGNMTIKNSEFTNNHANYGGAIFSTNNLTVTCCNFESNNVTNGEGGAIYNGLQVKQADPVKAVDILMTNNAPNDSSTDNGPYLLIGESSFIDNNAIDGDGGAIATNGDANISFSRIIGNSAVNGSAIYNSGDLMDASLNWWGTNMDPSINVYGNVIVTPWLILRMTANPAITKNGSSEITAILLYDSNGVYHDPANGKLPDGIPVTFVASNGNFNPTTGILVDGQAKTFFTANVAGKTSLSTTVDNQTLSITITADPQQTNTTNTNNTINYTTNNKSKDTIPMQHTGLPIAGLILAILSIIGGTILPRRK